MCAPSALRSEMMRFRISDAMEHDNTQMSVILHKAAAASRHDMYDRKQAGRPPYCYTYEHSFFSIWFAPPPFLLVNKNCTSLCADSCRIIHTLS